MKTIKKTWLLAVLTIAIAPTHWASAEENPPAAATNESDPLFKNTKIALVSEKKDSVVIATMNPNGSNLLNLTAEDGQSVSPSWSPEGKKIAYASRVDGKLEIHVMNADGTDKKRLTNGKKLEDDFFGELFPNYPTWSPDGKKIAFVSSAQPEHRVPEIYTMNADGSNLTRLTKTKVAPDSSIIMGLGPVAWSPDGNKIVFAATKDDRLGIHVINADGTNLVSFAKANGSQACWSPDGKKIVFMSQPKSDDNGPRIWSPGDDDKNDQRDENPKGKPDGANFSGIWIMDADGSNLNSLSQGRTSNDEFPSWLPDGKRIAFTSQGEGDQAAGIYIMNADGKNRTQIRKGKSESAVWSPLLR